MQPSSLCFALVVLASCSGSPFTLFEGDAGDAPPTDAAVSLDAGVTDAGDVVDAMHADASADDANAGDDTTVDASVDGAPPADAMSAPDTATPPALCCYITQTFGVPCSDDWTCQGGTTCASGACATGDPCSTANHTNGAVAACP